MRPVAGPQVLQRIVTQERVRQRLGVTRGARAFHEIPWMMKHLAVNLARLAMLQFVRTTPPGPRPDCVIFHSPAAVFEREWQRWTTAFPCGFGCVEPHLTRLNLVSVPFIRPILGCIEA